MRHLILSTLLFLQSLICQAAGAEGAPIQRHTFLLLPISGVIHGGTVESLRSALQSASTAHQGLIIQLDTPGGLLESTREIVKLLLNSEVPVLVFVGPSGARAGSAGTFITLAAHIAAMAPGTNIGAAHPISISGKDVESVGGKELARKIENDTIAFIETIARQRGRNIDWAKRAVQESSSITEVRALELKVIDIVTKSPEDLLRKANGLKVTTATGEVELRGAEAQIIPVVLPLAARLLNFLASPSCMFFLIVVMLLGLFIEFTHPGVLLPGVCAAVALALLLFANRVLPMNLLGVGLIILGAALLISEIYVTSFGLLGAGGLAAFFAGSMLLFDPAKSDVHVPLSYIASATITVALISAAVVYLLFKSLRLPLQSGQEGLIGDIGTVLENPGATQQLRVFVNGEYWNAEAAALTADLKPGDKVKIVAVENLIVKIERV